jgi:hypothetical protein
MLLDQILTRVVLPILAVTLFSGTAFGQEKLTQDSKATVTIVTKGDISVTKAVDGKTAVIVNLAPDKIHSKETRVTFTGLYSLDANGGVKEIKKPNGIELHVLSFEEFLASVPGAGRSERGGKDESRCHNIPNYPSCGNPICDQINYPGYVCRYHTGSGCACSKGGVAVACSELAEPSQEAKLISK